MTEDQLREASELWARGETTANIGRHVGVTRTNMAYIASQNRDLFPARDHNFYRASGFSAANIADRANAKNAIAANFPPKASGYDGVPSGRLNACACEYPLWGDHEYFDLETSLFCGAPRSDISEGRYCGFHATIARGRGSKSEREAIRDAVKVVRRAA